MFQNQTLNKIWRIVYPLLLYFLLDVLVVWVMQFLTLSNMVPRKSDSFLLQNVDAISGIVFLLLTLPIFYIIYKRDYNPWAVWIYKKPQYFVILFVMGAMAAHALSTLVSFMNIDQLIGNYKNIETTIFNANPVLVIVQTAVLAPLSEELLFRALLYKRLSKMFKGFMLPALISSAIFGIYHMNLAQGVYAFLFGLLAAAVYEQIGNLWASIALHMGGNTLSVIFVYTGLKYKEVWMYALSMLICFAAVALIYYSLIRPKRAETEKELY